MLDIYVNLTLLSFTFYRTLSSGSTAGDQIPIAKVAGRKKLITSKTASADRHVLGQEISSVGVSTYEWPPPDNLDVLIQGSANKVHYVYSCL